MGATGLQTALPDTKAERVASAPGQKGDRSYGDVPGTFSAGHRCVCSFTLGAVGPHAARGWELTPKSKLQAWL